VNRSYVATTARLDSHQTGLTRAAAAVSAKWMARKNSKRLAIVGPAPAKARAPA
jgi:ornithine cyclodeaminase/alanine dehydrogenase-like protein (mu-crystallin family)